ncbi:MAG: site-specific integrase [Nitrosopumilus sp.]|nr:site-specific integrase [Nitrosopumilus sp.]
MVDIHKAKERVERSKKSITRRFSKNNAEITCRFLVRLRLENKSYGRVANYADSAIRILKFKDDKKIQDWTRDDIENIHQIIADSEHANSVKKSTLTTLKRLYHFAKHNEIPDKSKGTDYDDVVSWITPGMFRDKFQKIQPKDLLTDDELLRLIQAVKTVGGQYVKRNIAIVFVMLEGAYRPGELFNIQIDGIEFESDFVRVSTTGKTGPKSLTLVASYEPLKEWLAEHPKSNDVNSYLLYSDNDDGLMNYLSFLDLLSKATQKAKIKKRVWPYLFRHTALTEYSKKLGNIVKIYGNWSMHSNALSTYEHLANSDQEDAILTLHGLKNTTEQESILFSKLCSSCKTRNSPDKSHCKHCGNELAAQLIQKKQDRLQLEQKQLSQRLESKFSSELKSLKKMMQKQQLQIQERDKLIEKLLK